MKRPQEDELCRYWDAQGPMRFLTSVCHGCEKVDEALAAAAGVVVGVGVSEF